MRRHPGLAPGTGHDQLNLQVGRRQMGRSVPWPLDQADALIAEVLVETGIQKFIWACEAIEIKMIYLEARNNIKFQQGKARAAHSAGKTKRAQQAAHQGGLASAQIALQINAQVGAQTGGQGSAQGQGCTFVRQFQGDSICGGTGGRVVMHQGRSQVARIRQWSQALGFARLGVASAERGLNEAGQCLQQWLAAGYHGAMDYMAVHGAKRWQPAELVPGTRSILMLALNYRPAQESVSAEQDALIARYAWGRDYHTLLRQRLKRLAAQIEQDIGGRVLRIFTDSAPVMEVELACQAGLGWRGKNTLLLSRQGSWFFLGEIFLDLDLPPDEPQAGHCGRCTACLDACPTGAFVAPYVLDARRCISYLTIEYAGSIPEDLRPAIGRRIYGCDDCQTVCPWNRHAPVTREIDFAPRLAAGEWSLAALMHWSEQQFLDRFAGSPIRRIGYQRWLRNLAVALGNSAPSDAVLTALTLRADHPSALVREHVAWALTRLRQHRPVTGE